MRGYSGLKSLPQGLGGGELDTEAAAAGRDGLETEHALVRLAELPGDVQAQAGAVVAGGEEGGEDLLDHARRDAGAAVDHFYDGARRWRLSRRTATVTCAGWPGCRP